MKIETIEKVLNYLSKRPYVEVSELINEIVEQLQKPAPVAPVTEQAPKTDDKENK